MTQLSEAWDRVILLCGHADKPTEESTLKTARAGHPNARAIVALEQTECYSCGAYEECPDAKPSDFARRDAIRTLLELLP